ncbi:hypothetical protein [Bacillus suaedaesalsae]|uniref:Endolytic transglycosylase MltG n=1 Tax=Bacillus suaedaesalsae TaxID=2810349 RepID=A0ABS2DI54_9BACI|nr:hypothetical protein [Bacillus suaedaesalsae]MBM6617246.1 hypothetical protein [Bacillus suaedaesalsae]
MTKGFMRGFSLGIILTCLLVFFIDNPFRKDNESLVTKETPLTEQSISAALKEKGQVAISTEEINRLKQIEQQLATKPAEEAEEATPAQDESSTEQDAPITYVLEIQSGMASTEISKKLAEVKVINNAADLDNYLQEKDWEGKIQIGTFEVNSKMSLDEIARIITKQ